MSNFIKLESASGYLLIAATVLALARLLRIATLPSGATWAQVYGVALLCGIGFTMSLFIGSLAFELGDFNVLSGVKMGVLIGSVLSAIAGLLVLHLALPKAESIRP